MDKAEKVHYEDQLEKYIENNKLPDYFEQLTKVLVLNQPQEPIQYLIEFLQQRKHKRIIFITGVVEQKRNEIATSCANYMNFKKISIEDVFQDGEDINTISNEEVNKYMLEEIEKAEKHYRGYIISGYPNNFNQSIFIKHQGILAERFYMLNFDKKESSEYYSKLYTSEDLIEKAITRDEIYQKEVKEMYDQYYDAFNASEKSKEEIVEVMKSQLKLKDQRTVPLRSPRLILITPPHLKKRANEIYDILALKYGLYKIKMVDLFQHHIDKQTQVGKFIYRNLKIKKTIPNDITTALMRTETLKPVSRHKGFLLEGYPSNKEELGAFKTYQINPHLVVILDDDEDVFLEQFKHLQIDPKFNQRYEQGAVVDEVTKKRLVKDTTSEEEWKEVIKDYRMLVKDVESQFLNHTQRFRLAKETTEKIIKSIDVFINNPKIYS